MDSFPQVVRCTLGQGGGPAYLRELGVLHDFEDLVERSVLAATNRAPRTVLGGWALNMPVVVRELGEPTRPIRRSR